MSGARHIHRKIDSLGASAAILCALHCMLLPLFITVLPLAGLGILGDHSVEAAFLIGTVILATLSLCWGTRVHGNRGLLIYLAIAVLCFVGAHGLTQGELGHAALMTIGGLLMSYGHILNRRLCKECTSCCAHEHK